MKRLIVVVVAILAFALTTSTSAGNPNLCASWKSAQTGSGSPFESQKACKKADEVFQPTLSISPRSVTAGQQFFVSAAGFHPNTTVTVYFAITGLPSYGYYEPAAMTAGNGSLSIPFVFAQCGNSPDDLTLTVQDSFGVYAKARMTLC